MEIVPHPDMAAKFGIVPLTKAIKQFQASITPDGDCVIWTGKRDRFGYGNICVPMPGSGRNKTFGAHRFHYQIVHGLIASPKIFVCHKCDNPSCVKLDHLFLGDQRANIQDMESKGRGRHPNGENNGLSKLTDTIVIKMRLTPYRFGLLAEWSREYGCSKTSIGAAYSGQTWTHLNADHPSPRPAGRAK